MAHNLPRGGVDPETFAGVLRARMPAKPAQTRHTRHSERAQSLGGMTADASGQVSVDIRDLMDLVG